MNCQKGSKFSNMMRYHELSYYWLWSLIFIVYKRCVNLLFSRFRKLSKSNFFILQNLWSYHSTSLGGFFFFRHSRWRILPNLRRGMEKFDNRIDILYHQDMSLLFDHSPDLEIVGLSFPGSPYFSLEALEHRTENNWKKSGIIAAIVWGAIVGILTWTDDGRLKIWQVEVRGEYRGRGIGSSLIWEAEKANSWQAHEAIGYLNDRRNERSARMFERAGYIRKDDQKFFKSL